MNANDLIKVFGEKHIRDAFKKANCRTDVAKCLKLACNGRSNIILNDVIHHLSINIDHFDKAFKNRKYEVVKKTCPICKVEFQTKKNAPREKSTCSHKCANSLFRTGENNGRRKKKRKVPESELPYYEICWLYHKKCCVVCSESLVVAAHHYNENHDDNRPENFVPLCPTHHVYWHSSHRYLIQEVVDNYVSEYLKRGVA